MFNEKVAKEKVSVIVNKDNNSIMLIGKKHGCRVIEKSVSWLIGRSSLSIPQF